MKNSNYGKFSFGLLAIVFSTFAAQASTSYTCVSANEETETLTLTTEGALEKPDSILVGTKDKQNEVQLFQTVDSSTREGYALFVKKQFVSNVKDADGVLFLSPSSSEETGRVMRIYSKTKTSKYPNKITIHSYNCSKN